MVLLTLTSRMWLTYILFPGFIAAQLLDLQDISNGIQEGLINLLTSAKDTSIPSNSINEIAQEYDFIIIGSGAAGAVLANRLTTASNWSVLVLSGGQQESLFGKVPIYATLLQFTDYNFPYTSEPTAGACLGMTDHRCALASGKAVGGSTAINYMTYIRGSQTDHNQWAEYVNDPTWGYNQVLPLYKKLEKVALGHFDAAYHGTTGEVSIEDPYKSQLAEAFLNSAAELGEGLGDYNAEGRTFSTLQATLKSGRRVTSAKAFLEPVGRRPNLRVLTEAVVTSIGFKGKWASTVNFLKGGKKYTVAIKNEVILAAEALNSAKILMKSGVGPQKVLKSAGIQVVADLPVGQNVRDQLGYTGLAFTMNRTVENILDVFSPFEAANFLVRGKGILTSIGGFEAVGFINTNVTNSTDYDVALFFAGAGSYSTDKGLFNRKSIRITDEIYNKFYKPIEDKPTWTVFPVLLKPKSVGSIALQLNPYKPFYNMNYLSDPQDKQTLIAAIRYIQRLAKATPFQVYNSTLSPVKVPSCEKLADDSDEYWGCALTVFCTSAFKYSGTCKMGPETDPSTVVDSNMKIHTLTGIRVIDASVIPFGITGDIYTTEMMMGEKAANLIVNDWKK